MGGSSLGTKISWFLYLKGMGVAKPDYLYVAKLGDANWFKVADALMSDKNMDGRDLILSQLLQARPLKPNPKRTQYLKLLGLFLSKGILDERRRVASFIEQNTSLFSTKDDAIYGPLMTAMRDSDVRIANTAERAVKQLRGEDPDSI